MILQAFTGSGDLDVDESKVEGLLYGYTERGMVSHSWPDTWYFDMLGDADASSNGVLMHQGDRGRLWLKFLSFRGLCCQVAVTPHAQWEAMMQGDYWGSGAGFGTKWSPVSAGMVTEAWD